jgi:hypothetical protein
VASRDYLRGELDRLAERLEGAELSAERAGGRSADRASDRAPGRGTDRAGGRGRG